MPTLILGLLIILLFLVTTVVLDEREKRKMLAHQQRKEATAEESAKVASMDETLHNAVRIGMRTMVGYWTEKYPIPDNGGNCFSVELEDGPSVRILNFGLENLEELMRRGLKFPLKVAVLSEGYGVVCDGRIGERWYATEFCAVCTPISMLPIPQRLKTLRQIERGEVTERLVKIHDMETVLVSFGEKIEPQFP
jgi:hypothetical protein